MKLVAELSCNHNGSKERALETIRQLRADCVKFQVWTKPMAVSYQIEEGPWVGMDLVELYERAHTPPEWLPDLFHATIDCGMVPMATPFDLPAVDLLERLSCPMYKIASFEAVDLRLVEYAASTEKPIIISTGQVATHELRAAVWAARKYTNDITLLHCVSEYPTPLDQANLRTMHGLQLHFPFCKIGVSDHTRGPIVPIIAASMGASMIEKHVTLARDSLDAEFSLLPEEFNAMVKYCDDAAKVRGKIQFNEAGELRRSLYWARDVKAGTVVDQRHLKTARPNLGLSPIKIDKVLGQKLTKDAKQDQPVAMDDVL